MSRFHVYCAQQWQAGKHPGLELQQSPPILPASRCSTPRKPGVLGPAGLSPTKPPYRGRSQELPCSESVGQGQLEEPVSKHQVLQCFKILWLSGTVCILGSDSVEGEEALRRVVDIYSKETGGFEPTLLVGSSIGAAAFGCLRIRIKSAGLEPTESKIDI